MRVLVVAVCFLLAGCILPGPGGDGGNAVGDANLMPGAFYSQGGHGGADGTPWGGMHGCNIINGLGGPGTVGMCEMVLRVDGSTFQVIAVNESVPMDWADLHLGVVEPGFVLRSGDRRVPLTTLVDLSSEVQMDGDMTRAHDSGLSAVLDGTVAVGQAFDVCGNATAGTATTWVRDVRPIGALMGILLKAPGCDGTPWKQPPVTLAQDYDLEVTEPSGQAVGHNSKNCISFPEGVAFTVDVRAEWAAQSPLADSLEFELWQGSGGQVAESIASASPFEHRFTSDGSPSTLAVFPRSTGAALDQPVALNVTVTFQGPRAQMLSPGPGACVR